MTIGRVALVLVVFMVMSSIGVGAVSTDNGPSATPNANATAQANGTEPMGTQISMFMQTTAAQTGGSVQNEMWVAAYAKSSNNSTKRALVIRRAESLNTTIAELRNERRALEAEYRSGDIDRTEYLARLSVIVGELAAISEGIEDASDRGQAVGVNKTRLDTLRSEARELAGGNVSQIARNLTGDHTPPGRPGTFSDGNQGQADKKKPNGPPTDRKGGPSAGNTTTTPTETPDDA